MMFFWIKNSVPINGSTLSAIGEILLYVRWSIRLYQLPFIVIKEIIAHQIIGRSGLNIMSPNWKHLILVQEQSHFRAFSEKQSNFFQFDSKWNQFRNARHIGGSTVSNNRDQCSFQVDTSDYHQSSFSLIQKQFHD